MLLNILGMKMLLPVTSGSSSTRNKGNQGGFLTVMILTMLLPAHLQARNTFLSALGESIEDITTTTVAAVPAPYGSSNTLDVQQTLNQLMQKFATMEVSIETRLSRLTESTAKGDDLLATLSKRLGKVDTLVEKVEALDNRLTEETSYLKNTLRNTNRDLQTVANHLNRLDGEMKDDEDVSRHDVRSNLFSRTPSDVDRLTTLLNRRLNEIERSVPRAVNEALAPFQAAFNKHISKSIDELCHEHQEGQESLHELGNNTFRKITAIETDLQLIAKKVYSSFQDIKDELQSARDEIVYEVGKSRSSSLGELRPVLQQVNQSVVQSVAKVAEGLNITLMEEAARRRGTEESLRADYTPLNCPDPTTVATLQEVKNLLQTLLRKSEDLRRGLTKQTSEGVDLLKFLHQRFSVLLRRMNTEPDHGQKLVAEIQEVESLVEASYAAVRHAQNAFIDSCKRIQEEEPIFEHKIAEILDRLITDINLGHKFNRMQLNELRRLVENLSETNLTSSGPFSKVGSDETTQEILRNMRDSQALPSGTSDKLNEVRDTILKSIETANVTVSGLENVEERVDSVSRTLVDIDWSNVRQKEPADQLVTAAKDLKGYARDQKMQSLNLHKVLSTTLEQLTILGEIPEPEEVSPNDGYFQPPDLDFKVPLYVSDEGHTPPQRQLTLPRTCTVALLQEIKNFLKSRPVKPTTTTPAGKGKEDVDTEYDSYDDEYEEDIPAWYTDPNFLSGNYGTPDLGYPVFREDEWRDISDYSSDDYLYIERPSTTESAIVQTSSSPTTAVAESTASSLPILPGGVESFFGFKTTPSKSTSKRATRKALGRP